MHKTHAVGAAERKVQRLPVVMRDAIINAAVAPVWGRGRLKRLGDSCAGVRNTDCRCGPFGGGSTGVTKSCVLHVAGPHDFTAGHPRDSLTHEQGFTSTLISAHLSSCWLVSWLGSCDSGGPWSMLVESCRGSRPSESVRQRSSGGGAGVPSRQPLLNAHVSLWEQLAPPCDCPASDICEKLRWTAMAPARHTMNRMSVVSSAQGNRSTHFMIEKAGCLPDADARLCVQSRIAACAIMRPRAAGP